MIFAFRITLHESDLAGACGWYIQYLWHEAQGIGFEGEPDEGHGQIHLRGAVKLQGWDVLVLSFEI